MKIQYSINNVTTWLDALKIHFLMLNCKNNEEISLKILCLLGEFYEPPKPAMTVEVSKQWALATGSRVPCKRVAVRT